MSMYAGLFCAVFASVLPSGAAFADLRICNTTPARVGVAIGYQDEKGWATEGWWNVSAGSCETLLNGRPPSRLIYVYAVDYERGGEWAGTNMMCVSRDEFIIRSIENCRRRGFQRSGFYEVDVWESGSHTIKLSDPEKVDGDDAAASSGEAN